MTQEKKTKKSSTTPNKAKQSGIIPEGYREFVNDLKEKIRSSQIKAAVSVNKELINLYWSIGRAIMEKQEVSDWGTGVIEKLAKDLQNAFPGIEGFSRTNIFRMRAFYLAYAKIPQAVGQFDNLPFFRIPWGHNAILLEKIKKTDSRLWYAKKTIEHGWSRSMLLIWIENDLYGREGKAITNFKDTLPLPQSDLAQQITRDPYCFQFLSLEKEFRENELEQGLIDHVQNLLSEFGRGFAFVGRQCRLEVDEKGFILDLLFYHTVLHCYVICELKNEEFKPEHAGKMNFYLGAVDRLLKKENDNPSIGLILCRSKSKIQVEIALQDIKKPIGVSDYIVEIAKAIPKELKSSLPTIEEIEAEFNNE